MATADALAKQRRRFEVRLSEINQEEDPLSVYHQYVQWILKNYGEKDPTLLELLQEATSAFKEDAVYRSDLRYLKIWCLYARHVERPAAIAIYALLLAKEIGSAFSVLYEEYARMLELDGQYSEAEAIYLKGIARRSRPSERLKDRYLSFKSRQASTSTPSSSLDPLKTLRPATQTTPITPSASSSSLGTACSSASIVSSSGNSTAESRYGPMLAPPVPGKRLEKYDISLLWVDGVEYSIQEARAKSLGLLGKKWPPPLLPTEDRLKISESSSPASSSPDETVKVHFNDSGQKSTRLMSMASRRKSLMGGEQTVTINTKEALADVFGMYNSPDKTARSGVGGKYAPVKKIEPKTPVISLRQVTSSENQTPANLKTPTAAFRPFVDENAKPIRKENSTPGPTPKFAPFVDHDLQKTPAFTTPRPALSIKEPGSGAPPSSIPRPPPNKITVLKLPTLSEDSDGSSSAENNVFKVFTPAAPNQPPFQPLQQKPTSLPLRDVFTDQHGKPQPKAQTHERAKSHHDILSSTEAKTDFMPFVDENQANARPAFKVFSRPPETQSHALHPKATPFTPVANRPAPTFTPFRDTCDADSGEENVARKPSWSNSVAEMPDEPDEDDPDQYEDDYQYDDEEDDGVGGRCELPQDVYEEVGDESYQEIPLGGRFGQFNVMTPITERTFEFTGSTRSTFNGGTPSEHRAAAPENERDAVETAGRLADELRQDEDEESEEEEPLEPLMLPSSDDQAHLTDGGPPGLVVLAEKTGSMSLLDTLNLSVNFKPSNPCNPFEPAIMATLMSRVNSDSRFYDLREQTSNMLESMQRFAKKARKTSGNTTNNTGMLSGLFLPLTIGGHKFSVCEKLGEGGFGSVFSARDLGERNGDPEDSDEDEEDYEDSPLVALKVVKPRNLWEYHVLRRLHSTLPVSLRHSLIQPRALYAFKDESFLVMELCPQGTLLNIVNNASAAGVSQQGACLDELLVMFFTIELLRLLEAMHKAGLIHGDLKIDNCLLRLEDVPDTWSNVYDPSGEGGWSFKGLKLIDFGRTIDTTLFPPSQQFVADWDTDERDCFEIRQGRPWTYHTDYFGLAGIIYCMLFGKYIQASSVTTAANNRHKIATPFKRYWQTDLWNRLFDILLNPSSVKPDGHLPVSDELGVVRREMEAWLQTHCNRTSNTLKGLLKKIEMSCI